MTLILLVLACEPSAVKVGDSNLGTIDSVPVELGPSFMLNPTSLDFGTVFSGSSFDKTVDILNNGTIDLNLVATASGEKAGAYSFLIEPEGTLTPGSHQTLHVNLAPTEWGNFLTTVSLDDGVTDAHADLTVTALAEEDADGDGVGSLASGGSDCDDTDALSYPGAAEVWYDGVDENCDGANDYDQDGDGHDVAIYGGDDCQDEDASAYPGASDYWYDGVDSDCKGNSDYDQDADGHDASAYGGDDCEDHNAAIHPGQAETWYDGVDTDCDGADDYDQDQDGAQASSFGGADCNDLDATINPSAAEVWYDGVDQDCAGDDDYDQDKDGVDSSLYGGSDCNDVDPTVTGPTAEVWDGQDNNCNGYADDFSISTLQGGVVYGTTTNQYHGLQGTISLGGDLTGDGVDDLVVGSASTSYGMAWVVSGGTWKGANGNVTSYDTAEFTNDNTYYYAGYVQGPQTDTDGDGVADLLVTATNSSYGYGISDWFSSKVSGSFTTSAAAATYTGDSQNDYTRVAASGDIDGDGLSEILLGSAWDAYYTSAAYAQYAGCLTVFDGYAGSYDLGDGTDYINGQTDYDYLAYSLNVQDLDDDGYADLLLGAPGYDGGSRDYGAIYEVKGNATLTWNGDQIDDASSLRVEGTTRSGQLGLDPLYRQGDLDGDGKMDLVVSSKAVGTAWLWWDLGAQSGQTTVSSASASFSGTAASFASSVGISDLDGDGADDLAVGDPGSDVAATDAGAVWIYSSHALWSGSVTKSDAVIWGAATGDALGAGLGGGYDVEKDGSEDLAIGASSADGGATNGGAVYLLSGH